ncbi:hypothetical protein CYD53_12910 [Bosea psychrotolerans]|uniref:Uncharacterized protein n=1 Tax=Bosea psychrotolerans TaxID=1871628 RepID=A0A2S4LTR7_9HYPH|nr:hypothetical protein CYD53_12910 [Bosea psychrotolerans]
MRFELKRHAFGGGDGLMPPWLRVPLIGGAQQRNADKSGSDPMRTP